MNIGPAIKEMRNRKDLTQQDLADRAGITRAYLSQIEGGKKEPKLATVRKISEALDVPAPVLVFLALDESDIPESRKASFEEMYQPMQRLIEQTVLEESNA